MFFYGEPPGKDRSKNLTVLMLLTLTKGKTMRHTTHNNGMYRWLVGLFVFAGCLAFAGCNTVEGAGQDVENAGEAVQDAAD